MNQPVIDILLGAADLLQDHGHCKGELSNDQGEHCAVGAIAKIDTDRRPSEVCLLFTDEAVAAVSAVGNHLHPGPSPVHEDRDTFLWQRVVDWNNAPERTAEEVIETFREVANSLT